MRRTPWLVWGAALAVYVLAVFHRTSLSVAGLVAIERFDISAAQLATFSMLQLMVYAAMQIPVGVLLDRFGSRRMLLVGLSLMTLGQFSFAVVNSYPAALGARVLIGIGDAMVFVSVLRLIVFWFPAARIPLVTQLTGISGQVGAIAAAIPMAAALSGFGWEPTFAVAGGVGLLLGVILFVVVRDAPGDVTASTAGMSLSAVRSGLRSSWAEPGTRLGLWTHFTTQFSVTVFTLLWGFPYLTEAEEVSVTTAGVLITVSTVSAVAAGPFLGTFVGRRPYHRSTLVLSIIAAIVTSWTAVLAWPGPAPLWLLVVLMVSMGIGGPTSMVGFDFVRSFNPSSRLGGATGIVNQGGFVASLLIIVAIGVVLDVLTPPGADGYSAGAFTAAMSTQYVAWAVGVVQILRYRGQARRRMAQTDPEAFAVIRRGQRARPGKPRG
ncbi:MAG: MFS transporter [Actinomycetota bacterium]|nr:MFS transporter [Actinomycetota bacterium]